MEQQISQTKNERSFPINEFIEYLNQQKAKGATHLRFSVSNDPLWRFEWVETFKTKSEVELRQERITVLKTELDQLNNGA
jgi:acyl carrier protein phosphodiesterase